MVVELMQGSSVYGCMLHSQTRQAQDRDHPPSANYACNAMHKNEKPWHLTNNWHGMGSWGGGWRVGRVVCVSLRCKM